MKRLSIIAFATILLFTSCEDILNWLESNTKNQEFDQYRITSIRFFEGNNSYESMKQELFHNDTLLMYQFYIYKNAQGVVTDTMRVNYSYNNKVITEEFANNNNAVTSKNIYEVNEQLLLSMQQSYLRNNQWYNENKYEYSYQNDTLTASRTYVSVNNTFELNSRYAYDFYKNNQSKWKRYNDQNELISQNTYYHNAETLDSMVLYSPDATGALIPILKEHYSYSNDQLKKVTRWNTNQGLWTQYNTTTYQYNATGLMIESVTTNNSSSETVKYSWEKGKSNYATLKIDPAILQTGIAVLKGEVPK